MGIPVMVMGESGSGKSTALRNFEPDEIGIFNVANKPLPFRKKIPMCVTADYRKIESVLKDNKMNAYAIDDSQFLMVFESFDKAKIKGYEKFTDFALHFQHLLSVAINQTSKDTIIYFLHHTQDKDNGRVAAKTIGKMLDSQLTLEGLFPVVLHARYKQGRYIFSTQTDGNDTAKSPMGMFDDLNIDNDLKAVDTAIRQYWNLAPLIQRKNESEDK